MIQISNSFLYLDPWTLGHIFWGILIILILLKFFKKTKTSTKFGILFSLFTLWEIFEFISFKLGGPLIYYGIWDVFYDIVFGMFGGLIYLYLYKKITLK